MSNYSFKKKYWLFVGLFLPMMSHAAAFFTGAGKVLGIGAILGAVLCCFFLYEAVYHYRQNQPIGKDIVALLICAGATAIVGLVFGAFGMGSAVVTPIFE